jgi:hypothetical protein
MYGRYLTRHGRGFAMLMWAIRFMRNHAMVSLLLVAFVGTCVPAMAEVLDKEPTVREVWVSAAWWACIGFVACSVHPALLVVILAASATFGMPTDVLEIAGAFTIEPDMGYAMWAEGGVAYVGPAVAAVFVVLIADALGCYLFVLRRRRRRRHVAGSTPIV